MVASWRRALHLGTLSTHRHCHEMPEQLWLDGLPPTVTEEEVTGFLF